MVKYTELRGKALLFLFCLWFIWFINFAVRMVFSPILPLVEDEFAVNHAQASSIFAFVFVGYSIGVVIAGLFSGRFGHKKSIIFSLLTLGLISFSIPFIYKFWLLYFFAFILGSAAGFYIPSAVPLITEYFSESNWGKVLTIHDTAASIAVFAAPLITIFLLQFFPWRGIFVAFGLIFLFCAVVFCFVITEVKHGHPPKRAFRALVRIWSLWLLAIIWIFASGAHLGIYAIVPLYLTKELGLTIGYANTLLAISRLGAIVVVILCGFLIDRFNLRVIMFLILLITGMLTILMGLASASFMGIILFLQASCVAAFFPAGIVAIAKTFGSELRSLATGIILALTAISGIGLIPYLLGVSGDLCTFRLGIAVLGIFVALSSRLVFYLKELA